MLAPNELSLRVGNAVDPYPVPTVRATRQLTSIVNARDLAEACRAITPGDPLEGRSLPDGLGFARMMRCNAVAETPAHTSPGRVLRAANPTAANEQDVLVLREMLLVTRLVCEGAICMLALAPSSFVGVYCKHRTVEDAMAEDGAVYA